MIEYQQNFHVNKITQKGKIKYIFDFVKEISLVSKSGYILPNHKVQGI